MLVIIITVVIIIVIVIKAKRSGKYWCRKTTTNTKTYRAGP